MSILAIDLGGTNIRAAKINHGNVLSQSSVPCPFSESEENVLSQIFKLIDTIIDKNVCKICVGVPSVVDYTRGIVYEVQNIPSWKEVHLKNILEKRYSRKVKVDNDVNCYTLGEKYHGSGKFYKDIVGITIGTGIGAGIIIDNKLYRGTNTGAGEIGCLPYLDADYEQYCSNGFMKMNNTNGKNLSIQADNGDKKALELWNEFGYHLGKFFQAILYAYDPEAIIIGGGITASAQYFIHSALLSMKDHFPYQIEINKVKIKISSLKYCNLLGASHL